MEYDIPWLKVPSAMITNEELMKACAATGKKIIFSTGMSTYEEIDQAVEWLQGSDIVMLHCNSTYPAPLEDLNLSCIKTLKQKYDCEVGYSGHEFRLGTTVAAVYLGATYLERHITLDRTMWGSDHMCSVEPQGLIKLVKGVRELETAYGDGIKTVTEGELGPRKKLRGY
jgi:N-acetylneuraminate synthase